nr:phosphoglycerate dehydrogenase [Propionibacterium sp.]
MKLLIPADAPFTLDPVPEGVVVATYDPHAPLPAALLDADAAVVWGFAGPVLTQLASRMPNLRWVQAMTAGPDALLAAGLPGHIQITVGRGFHDRTVTELAVALTLAATTDLHRYAAKQRAHEWAGPGFRPLHDPDRLATIIDAQVLIWGFGSIGQHMAPVFTALGAHVRGVATTAGERAGYPCFTDADLPRLLPETEVLVMVLPHAPSTRNALNAERLALMKSTAWVVNVGRGTCVDEAALVAALEAGRLGGAALDVFAVEPLPADSPLWDAPRTILTPHVAGGRPLGVEAAVRANIAHFLAGEPLELRAT